MLHLIRYCKPFLFSVFLMVMLLLVQVVCDLALPGYMSDVVDEGVQKGNLQYIKSTGIIMLFLALGSIAAAGFTTLLSAKFAAEFSRDVRKDVFKSVEHFSHTEFDRFSTASLITRTTNDIQQIQSILEIMPRIIFYAPVLAVGGIIKVVATKSGLGWIIAVGVAVVMVLVAVLISFVVPNFKRVQDLTDKLNLLTRQTLSGTMVIRVFSTQAYEEKKFDAVNRKLAKTNLFVNRVMVLMRPGMMLVMNLMTLLIVWFGAKKVDMGTIQVGTMIALITYTTQIIMAFLGISMIALMLPRAQVSANRIVEVLHAKPAIKNPENPKNFIPEMRGTVEFRNVTFKYEKAEKNILTDISFTARPGETTAIIGSTGSGKSTIINLILRFYDVTGGAVLMDGVDIRDADLKELRERIGYVPQKAQLLSGTIESNLKYGNPAASDETMMDAAKIAQAYDFIEEKHDKFRSRIAQSAGNVSGGQKQRLAIARALVKDAEVYLFDDSFSALDFKTDAALRQALEESHKDRTKIIVTQRVSSIKHAQQILVVDDGAVVGKGTHRELLDTCGVYKEIALSQLSEEELYS